MVFLTIEENSVLDYFDLCQDQLEKWIIKCQKSLIIHINNRRVAVIIQIINMIFDYFSALREREKYCNGGEIFADLEHKVKFGEINEFVEEILFLDDILIRDQDRASIQFEIKSNWIELYKILNKIYFEIERLQEKFRKLESESELLDCIPIYNSE